MDHLKPIWGKCWAILCTAPCLRAIGGRYCWSLMGRNVKILLLCFVTLRWIKLFFLVFFPTNHSHYFSVTLILASIWCGNSDDARLSLDEYISILIWNPVYCEHQSFCFASLTIHMKFNLASSCWSVQLFVWTTWCCFASGSRGWWPAFFRSAAAMKKWWEWDGYVFLQIWERMWNHFLCFCPNP